ncbi:hypothetical protein CONPUDRAFT_67066 [Coniophora puteana RWD-64-598 SS2]|uniref:Uncharacterized protein n=1 Tax=Coniophora puteana (strain RWD-64-598) TaxID=741705 RepID=R7SEG4_CONPW|nr:uncharacterized protein CONPUDRAFT_67066 [Coniophora puteana RWD-64-598 SS2]EIW74576.1 hypothetical protein CONPUDRAFT_67066 [Coniophora puteana RWD-64-598 SS2]
MNPQEDVLNKPWRPIACGLISLGSARVLRWPVLALCLAYSYILGVFWFSIALVLAFFFNNDLGFDSHWLGRGVWVAYGYAMFDLGAARVACSSYRCLPQERLVGASVAIFAIVFSTIHAQDFRDVEGDTTSGRRTIPIIWPEGSRHYEFWSIFLWSVIICGFLEVGKPVGWPFVCLGMLVGAHLLLLRTTEDDRRSYILYNVSFLTLTKSQD